MFNHHVLSLEHTSVCITMFTLSYMNTPEVSACSLIFFLWFCFRFVVHPFHYPGFSIWVTESTSQRFTCYGKEKAALFRRESPTLRLKKVCHRSEIIQISLISCKWVRVSVLFLGVVLFYEKQVWSNYTQRYLDCWRGRSYVWVKYIFLEYNTVTWAHLYKELMMLFNR